MARTLRTVTGTIEMTDGTTSEFMIDSDGNWHQWGAVDNERLADSAPVAQAIEDGIRSAWLEGEIEREDG